MSSNIYLTKHMKMIFSLYRAKIRLANSMGYSYGLPYKNYVDDLSMCVNIVETGEILKSPKKGGIIGTTIKMQYKKCMRYSPNNKLNLLTDRGFIWLRKLNDLHFKYMESKKVTTSAMLLLPGPDNSSYNIKPLRF